MALFDRTSKSGGIMDVIRCDEPSYLIWKWHPTNTLSGNNRRENAIRWGSSLRVREGSVAVFVYKQSNKIVQEYIEGPYDSILKTENLPVIAGIVGLAYAGDTPFQAEVYFINLAQIIQTKFAVPYFDVYDPRFLDYGVPIAVRGTITYKITDYKEFIRLHRLDNFSMKDFENQIKDAIIRYTKKVVANAPEDNQIPVIQIERKIDQINDLVQEDIKERLYNDFGVSVSGVDIAAIDVDKTSEGYQQLKSVTQDLTTATLQAQTEVGIKELNDTQRLGVLEREGRIKLNLEEEQYARHKQTQTANYMAYQTEAQEHVGVEGARGLGQMGSNGGGDMGGGMNPAAMMAGIAVGGAIGQNIAGTMSHMMNGTNQMPMNSTGSMQIVPPPIPVVAFHVAVDGKPTGPYDINTLTQMAFSGKLNQSSLVWKNGMSEWKQASQVEELKGLFTVMPPVPDNARN